MDKILDQYLEKFGEQFPLMLCRHLEETEIAEIAKDCIDKGEPYIPELDPEANY